MKEKDYSVTIENAIRSFLNEENWKFAFDEEEGLFGFGLSLSSKIRKINYIIDVSENRYIVYAVAPIGADKDDKKRMAAMAEFVCRVNCGLKNGNFEFDMNDGEVRFKCFVDCEGITPSKEMVQNSILCPAAMFKRYGSGIVDVIFGNVNPKEAVEKCEKAMEGEICSLMSKLMEGEGELGEMRVMFADCLDSSEDDE